MRIVNRETFLRMGGQVLFMLYDGSSATGTLSIKVGDPSTFENDYQYDDLPDIESHGGNDYFDELKRAEQDQDVDLKLDLHSTHRDGLYEDEQLFAVFTSTDVTKIIERLQEVMEKTNVTTKG